MRMFLSGLIVLCTLQLTAQNFDLENTRHISVTGRSMMEVVPDTIEIDVFLKEYYDGKQKIGLASLENTFFNLVKINGLSPDSYRVDSFANYREKYKKNREDVLAFKKYILVVNDSRVAAKLVLDLSRTDIRATISSKSHTNIIGYRKQVKKDALVAAQDKADYLLEAISVKRGRVLRVREVKEGESDYQVYKRVRNGSNSMSYAEKEVTDTKNGLAPIIVTYEMEATFEIDE